MLAAFDFGISNTDVAIFSENSVKYFTVPSSKEKITTNLIKKILFDLELPISKVEILGVTGGLVFLGMMYGPQAAFFAELFSTEVRYSGASLGYQIGAIIGGSFAPTIATLLWKNYDIFWVSVYIAFASLLSLLSVYFLTETYQKDLNE